MSTDKRADTLRDAWPNFNPTLPLKGDSPFFVDYERRPLTRFKAMLLNDPGNPTALFLAGFRGAGKSTHLNRLADDTDLADTYIVAKYSISDQLDFNNVAVSDLVVSTAHAIISSLPKGFDTGASHTKEVIEDLLTWGKRIEERIQERDQSYGIELNTQARAGADLPFLGFLAKLTTRVRAGGESRDVIRLTLGPELPALAERLNRLAEVIYVQTRRRVFVIVDDTDKLDEKNTAAVFRDGLPNLLSLKFHVLYTVREIAYFSPDFPDMLHGPNADMLRNVRLWDRGNRSARRKDALETLHQFVANRMSPTLITPEATDLAALYSGGIFRQFAEPLYTAIYTAAFERKKSQVQVEDVEYAVNELRKKLWRPLNQQDKDALLKVFKENDHPSKGQLAPLFRILALLEYENDELWYDVNPLLWQFFKEPSHV